MSDLRLAVPANATSIELTAVDVINNRFTYPNHVETLWNSGTCPANTLPYLAWGLRVDFWNPDWSEEIRREVARTAVLVHRIKGTPAAVENALDAVGVDAEIIEWWQKDPVGENGTFTVRMSINANITNSGLVIDDERVDQIVRQIEIAKRKSQHFDIELSSEHTATITVGAYMTAQPRVRAEAELSGTLPFNSMQNLGAAFYAAGRLLLRADL
jgi:phage tail P2-like protein